MPLVTNNLETEACGVSGLAAGTRSQNALLSDLSNATKSDKRHILTVGLEDWFQVGSFHDYIDSNQWYRFESRLEKSTQTTLELLRRFDTHATFFVLGWIAERMPELVRSIADQGHEVASRGYIHQDVSSFTREEFVEDVLQANEFISAATGREVVGYRIADGWLSPADLWMLDALADCGMKYDSSICPMFREYANEPFRRFVHEHQTGHGLIHEVPLSTTKLLGFRLPVSGGNWFRQFPHRFLKKAFNRWLGEHNQPFVMYFHTWELDPDQPHVSAVGRLTKLRHYRNLDKMRWMLEDYLGSYSFGTVAEHLDLSLEPRAKSQELAIGEQPTSSQESLGSRLSALSSTPISIVIPCYNEEATLPYLAKTLERLEFELSANYAPQFVFVDDRSSDETWKVMQTIFGEKTNCKLVQHEQNSGVSAAILTGIKNADTEVVCSMDCDCSYDPLELKNMLPLLTDDVDLVTASPYHPEGNVKNVPKWRLFLSGGLSRLYRTILPPTLHTWTSCFRVYRKSAVENLPLCENGFLGTAEMVAELSLAGGRIVEHPATLEVRIFGESKMKTFRTILGHLRLIGRFLKKKRRGGFQPPQSTQSPHSTQPEQPRSGDSI